MTNQKHSPSVYPIKSIAEWESQYYYMTEGQMI